ncbi:hypothetical protein BZG36_04297 [Bifiguratus adelaidae]|uniref:ICE2-domain-containing protein n=1 Tax=Bifiguratus adelaidae TaxID=1938954 RepID=A0A261XVF3_9FUNG|nr:hypothetical protein BZG36_04297 [Bifiguratus adelaidae]
MLFFIFNLLSWSYSVSLYALVILILPLAFDVGGKETGLCLSLCLLYYYAILGVASSRGLVTYWPGKVLRSVVKSVELPFIIGAFYYAFQPHEEGGHAYYEALLRFCGPLFSLLEGIASVLTIQSVGIATRYCVDNWHEGYQILFLILSAKVYVVSFLALYYMMYAPYLDVFSAAGVGAVVTLTLILSSLAMFSGKGVVTECALLLAYVSYTLCMISGQLPSSTTSNTATNGNDLKPPIDTTSAARQYADPIHFPSSNAPPYSVPQYPFDTVDLYSHFFHHLIQTLEFVFALAKVLSWNAIVVVFYRLVVLVAMTKIIPAMRSGDGSEGVRVEELLGGTPPNLSPLLTAAKPTLLMVYTHLLLCHFGHIEGSHLIWQWLNIILCLALYATDLVLSSEEGVEGILEHLGVDRDSGFGKSYLHLD